MQSILGVGMVVSRLEQEVIAQAAEYVILHMNPVIPLDQEALPVALPLEIFHEHKLLRHSRQYLPSKPTAKELE